ncbi:SDR family NAD(P)-dependent oxidoreductase [Caldimonas sp. KR1-144]|uniref:SDR family NAD(P)-dependent oxidoreductase n=1 Tax=Caldimonas sp. KR1-144 TaxID=3400911 RepID=UPI003C034670
MNVPETPSFAPLDEATRELALAGKSLAVTGGFGALGRAVTRELLAAGARVSMLDKAPAPADVPDNVVALGGIDLGDAAAAHRALDDAALRLGGLSALVNVAGGFRWETVEQGSVDTWDALYAMNLRTTLLASQAALPHLLAGGHGRIVNVGASAAGHAGLGMGAYAAAKSGVARLTEAMAEEFKDRGITVNAVLPSIIDTPANRCAMPNADHARWVSPRALARVVVFLLSDDAAAITGALIPVKGRT